MIVIVDYGMGNLGSIANMLRKIGSKNKVSSDIEEILSADKLILPGVGAFDRGMKKLAELNLVDALNEKVIKNKTPVLGICLGMQLLTKGSEEGTLPGLGWIDANTIKFNFSGSDTSKLKIPHMGWNFVRSKDSSPLYRGWDEEKRFYFVHSYHVVCEKEGNISGKTTYGLEFASSIEQDHIFGVQFHPEKSHKYGKHLLSNFACL